uniref:Reverse transcriptase zinc-binding domain-containing protein n=1 Tax=Fagus sylvatica TaxID=28930 RepID=A0A2N9HF02_FAGSY
MLGDQIKPKQPVVNWWQIVRFLKAIPRCFRYLVDNEGWRLAKCGIGSDLLCVFCRAKIENRDHLFFKCSAAQRIWRKIKNLCCQDSLDDEWDSLIYWVVDHWKGKTLSADCCRLEFSAAVNYIWSLRNAILH